MKEYQKQAERSCAKGPDFELSDNEFMLIWLALGLAGEVGEVVDYIKKGLLHQHGLDKGKLEEEIGDVLWYIANLCTKLDMSLSDVMERNVRKLRTRYPSGWSSADSKNRTV